MPQHPPCLVLSPSTGVFVSFCPSLGSRLPAGLLVFVCFLPRLNPYDYDKHIQYRLWVRINLFSFYLSYYFLSNSFEKFLNFFPRLRRSLEKHKPIRIGKLLPFLITNFPFIFQIYFIANKNNLYFIMTMIFNLV